MSQHTVSGPDEVAPGDHGHHLVERLEHYEHSLVAGGQQHGPSTAAMVVAAACGYEVVAQGLNATLEATVLPSLGTLVSQLSPRLLTRYIPPWVPLVGMMGVGFVLFVVSSKRPHRHHRLVPAGPRLAAEHLRHAATAR